MCGPFSWLRPRLRDVCAAPGRDRSGPRMDAAPCRPGVALRSGRIVQRADRDGKHCPGRDGPCPQLRTTTRPARPGPPDSGRAFVLRCLATARSVACHAAAGAVAAGRSRAIATSRRSVAPGHAGIVIPDSEESRRASAMPGNQTRPGFRPTSPWSASGSWNANEQLAGAIRRRAHVSSSLSLATNRTCRH